MQAANTGNFQNGMTLYIKYTKKYTKYI
jgi:hypothetical protein